ncbi:hypothetical protein [Ohtaekwangia koreensis]|uniref:Uncharacterized protein n=1 Tax=Ohtaekwangia koreensis TaxID=688867 RepID=A0A1T5MK74_9BACT|nr:hypothetical protein [Ohtaekwangia koreensis]SKC88606.1 hypothetical protein SAMN05660236_5637 [Ohtaekwangia koreensis]
MTETSVHYTDTIVEENIPLNGAELKAFDHKIKEEAKIPWICALCTLPVIAFIGYLLRGKFNDLKYYDFLLLGGASVFTFFFVYGVGLLFTKYSARNLRKDILRGKSKLTGIVIGKDKTEYGEYLSFAGQHKNSEIRIRVSPEDYSRYKPGIKLIVEYLHFTKEALLITPA